MLSNLPQFHVRVVVVARVVSFGLQRRHFLGIQAKVLSSTASRISMLAPGGAMVSAPFSANFMLPEASLPAVEILPEDQLPGRPDDRDTE